MIIRRGARRLALGLIALLAMPPWAQAQDPKSPTPEEYVAHTNGEATIVPAGDMTPGTGHHHLYLDADLGDTRAPVPTVPAALVLDSNWVNVPVVPSIAGGTPSWWTLYSSICARSVWRLNLSELTLASAVELVNCGMTVAARTAMITTTINTSISVKPEQRDRIGIVPAR